MKLSNMIKLSLKKPDLIVPHLRARLSSRLSKLTDYALMPKVIHVGINNTCNAKCIMCDFGQRNTSSMNYKVMRATEKDMYIDLGLFKKLIADVRGFKPLISFKVVEPLLNKNLLQLISICKKNHLRVELTTNGYLLPLLSEDLIKAGLDGIQISIDGPPEIHDKIRGMKGAFRNATDGIKLLHFYREKYAKNHHIKINYTMSNLNYMYIVETLECLRKLKGLDMVNLQCLSFITEKMKKAHNKILGDYCPVTTSSVCDDVNLSQVDVEKFHKQIMQVKNNQYPFLIGFIPNIAYTKEEIHQYFFEELKFLKEHDRCGMSYQNSYIDVKGNVKIHSRCFDLLMGNINNEHFKEIWNNAKYREFRRRIKRKAFPGCSRCCGIL